MKLRITDDADHPFQLMPTTHFGRCRPPISDDVDHLFQLMSTTHFG